MSDEEWCIKMDKRITTMELWKEAHIKEYEKFKSETNINTKDLLTAVSANTLAVGELVKETRGIVEMYRDFTGVIRIAGRLQKFAIFCTKWGILGSIALYAAQKIREVFPNLF